MPGPRSQPRVVLHVGLPKSGTTFLQRSLARNAEALGDRGVLYPQTPDDVMFRAALDVRGNHKAWGRRRAEVEGSWDELCRRAHDQVGTTVLSHELLAAASGRQVDAALTLLKGLDVHVVVTARDPARQLVSEWQEGVKHGRHRTFAEFEETVRAGQDRLAERFRASQDLPDVLRRWGHWVPADRVHVVVGPPAGADARSLWARFADAAGFDEDGFPPAEQRSVNASLDPEAVDLLRRVNARLDGRLAQPAYGRLVKHRLAHELLAGLTTRPVRPTQDLAEALVPVGEQWAEEVGRAGYVVHGDLRDLVPVVPSGEVPHPDAVDPARQVEVAGAVLADLLLDLDRALTRAAERDEKRRSWKKQAKLLRRKLAEAV